MQYYQPLLLTPGPVPVSEQIPNAVQLPMVGHRSTDFEETASETFKGLKPVFGSKSEVLVLTSSGTSVLETSMLNIANPDDHIIIIVSGALGNRFKQITRTYYNHIYVYSVNQGEAVIVGDFITYLKQLNVPVTAVFTQFCETSTGVIYPVHQLGHALKTFNNSLYFTVDGVSCIGTMDADLTKDKVDVLVSGSQKAIVLPLGLAFVTYSDRTEKRFTDVGTLRFYLDLNRYIKSQGQNSTPFTPDAGLSRGINVYIELVRKEGLNHVISCHFKIRSTLRAALKALELKLLVKNDTHASPTMTSFVSKNQEKLSIIENQLKSQLSITIAKGQGHLKGQTLRIGHMGKISPFDVLAVVSTLEITLTSSRNVDYIGTGIAQLMEVVGHKSWDISIKPSF